MKTFWLDRSEDASGVSGVGLVAQGVQFDNGKCALSWVADGPNTVTVYDSIDDVEFIHSHKGRTRIKWGE